MQCRVVKRDKLFLPSRHPSFKIEGLALVLCPDKGQHFIKFFIWTEHLEP